MSYGIRFGQFEGCGIRRTGELRHGDQTMELRGKCVAL